MEMVLAREDLVSIVGIASLSGMMERTETISIPCEEDLLDAAQDILCGYYNSRSEDEFYNYAYDELCKRFPTEVIL